MNEFIEAIGEFKMKTQRLSNLPTVSLNYTIIICILKSIIYY